MGRDTLARRLFYGARRRAKRDGLLFNLTVEDIHIPVVCPALGIELRPGVGHVCPTSPTLDRIVPELGYTKGNVVVISNKANAIKHTATPDELHKVARFFRRLVTNGDYAAQMSREGKKSGKAKEDATG